jgi:arylsulfatase A-like enzyme
MGTVPQTILKGCALAIAAVLLLPLSSDTAIPQTERPNILFVMTDDMPENLLPRMPRVDRRIVSKGITFQNAYVSQSLCCPSRASILTGKYPHNTGVWSNGGPSGGVDAFRERGHEQRSVATWLAEQGYRTGFTGKYMNGYDGSYVPPGWSYWYGRFDGEANENGQIISTRGQFHVDQERAQLSEWHRNQLRSLRSVDEMVGALLGLLWERGELKNTYVVFTTDNGVHMGEHRWWLGAGGSKNTAYEEAAGVPLAVRGPGIPADQVRPQLALNNDFAPTFADMADAPVPEDVDGRSLLPLMNSTPTQSWRTAVLNEKPGGGGYFSLITDRYTYVEYKTGERELYDRQQDPYQLSSIHLTASPALLDSLHARLAQLKACAGQSCQTGEDTP